MPEAQTWLIIIKFKNPQEVKKSPIIGPFFQRRGDISPAQIVTTEQILLDRPMLIIPEGQAKKIEVFPITDTTLIHSKNFKRYIK